MSPYYLIKLDISEYNFNFESEEAKKLLKNVE